eukprot:scaffold18468_cov48-Phaeocystis_antarctica.AAC.3
MVELSVAKGLFRGYTPAPAIPPRSSTSCEARLVLRAVERREIQVRSSQRGRRTFSTSQLACRLARHVRASHLPPDGLGDRAAHPVHLLPARQRPLGGAPPPPPPPPPLPPPPLPPPPPPSPAPAPPAPLPPPLHQLWLLPPPLPSPPPPPVAGPMGHLYRVPRIRCAHDHAERRPRHVPIGERHVDRVAAPQHGQSADFGSAPARLVCLLGARLAALGSLALQ